MPIEHDRGPWGNWLRAIKGSRGPNIVQIGQPIEDQIRATVLVEDLKHLAAPTRLVQWGGDFLAAQAALNLSRVEIRAVRPFRLWYIQAIQDGVIEVADAHLLATADLVPVTQFSGLPQCRVRVGDNVAAAAAGAMRFDGIVTGFLGGPVSTHPVFVPQGKILRFTGDAINTALQMTFICEEVPDPATAP